MGRDDARSDAELVAAAVGGDRTAFAAIYERYVDRVHGFAYSFLRSSADAADATQDTFVRAAEQLANLRDPSKLRSWLFAIARTVCLARIRRRGRDTPEADMSAMADAGAAAAGASVSGPASAAEQSELARLVWDAAAALDDRDRLVLELSVREGLDGGELADALGVSPAHAHVLAHRARQRVERALGAFLVARLGRSDCPDLARMLAGWDGRFSMVVRKKVAHHVDGCETCEDTRARTLSPVALLSAVPLVPLAADRRDAVLAAATSALDAGPAPRPDGYRDDGFPPADPVTRRRPRFAGWGAVAVVAAVLALLLLALTGGGTGPTRLTAEEEPAETTTASADPGGDAQTTTVPAAGGPDTTVVPGPAPTSPSGGPPATTVPPAAAPPAGAPATTATTAAGPASTLPSPDLTVSSETVDLGTTGTTGRVRLTNLGPGEAAWSARSPAAGLAVAPAGGTLPAGGSADLVLTLDRGAFPEGPVEVAVGVDGGREPVSVRVLATVGRPPAVGPVAASPTTVRRAGTASVCTPQTSRVVATVSDESGVAGAEVVLPSGRVAMTLARDGTYGATVGPFATAGTLTFTVEAVDRLGNRGASAPMTLTVLPC